MADEAVHLGPPPAAESYLVIDKIVEACRQTGAQAVHPGYGFCPADAFPTALGGIAFRAPIPRPIPAMGDKIEFKKSRCQGQGPRPSPAISASSRGR